MSKYNPMRAQAIAILGGKCVCCGAIHRLKIDHTHGNGAEHRILLGTKKIATCVVENPTESKLGEFAVRLLCVECHDDVTLRGGCLAREGHLGAVTVRKPRAEFSRQFSLEEKFVSWRMRVVTIGEDWFEAVPISAPQCTWAVTFPPELAHVRLTVPRGVPPGLHPGREFLLGVRRTDKAAEITVGYAAV